MKAPLFLVAAVALTLPGCAGVVMADATRKESRGLIASVMATERPGLDSAEAAACVQKAMTFVETAEMGLGDTSVLTAANRDRILAYAARPEAVGCLDTLPVAEVGG